MNRAPVLVSVILPAYNPGVGELRDTLAALRAQTLPLAQWELVVVDNRSTPPVDSSVVAWHPQGTVIREETPGLVAARVAGFKHSSGKVLVVVDQDNVLAPGYLATALQLGQVNPWLGTWGGVISPRYEKPELAPPASLHSLLTLRTASRDLWSNDIDHHDSTPWGAGLCLRREVADWYMEALRADPLKGSLDLKGDQRLSGGDTDICYTGCAHGLGKGVFRSLQLEHLIPASRCTSAFLCKNQEGREYSAVLHHLVLHGTLPAESRGLVAFLRRLWRRRRLSPLEREVEAAGEAGRRRAFRELAARRTG